MHIAVCDDSMIERKIIMNALYEYASMHSVHFDITEYDSGMNLLYDVQDGQDYNLVFLDIIMDEISGIDVAHRIREANSKSSIVFLTASPILQSAAMTSMPPATFSSRWKRQGRLPFWIR